MDILKQQKKNLSVIIALTCTLFLFLSLTNPNRVALGFLVIPIILIALISYFFTRMVLSFWPKFTNKTKQRNGLSVVVGFMVASLLIFQSIGQLTIGDITIVIVLGVLTMFYITRLF